MKLSKSGATSRLTHQLPSTDTSKRPKLDFEKWYREGSEDQISLPLFEPSPRSETLEYEKSWGLGRKVKIKQYGFAAGLQNSYLPDRAQGKPGP